MHRVEQMTHQPHDDPLATFLQQNIATTILFVDMTRNFFVCARRFYAVDAARAAELDRLEAQR